MDVIGFYRHFLELNVQRGILKMGKTTTSAPWWLETGTEVCSICHQLYIYETECRCSDCDGPACANCVTIESTSIICVPCSSSEEEG